MAQMNPIRRSPSPSASNRPPTNRTAQQNKMPMLPQRGVPLPMTASAAAAIRPNQQIAQTEAPESSLDLFDSFGDYEAAFYRVNVLKPLLNRLFETPPVKKVKTSSNFLEGLEADLIAATKRKISSLQERTDAFQKSHKETMQKLKNDRQAFWSLFNELEQEHGVDLDQLYQKLVVTQLKDMEIDNQSVYASL